MFHWLNDLSDRTNKPAQPTQHTNQRGFFSLSSRVVCIINFTAAASSDSKELIERQKNAIESRIHRFIHKIAIAIVPCYWIYSILFPPFFFFVFVRFVSIISTFLHRPQFNIRSTLRLAVCLPFTSSSMTVMKAVSVQKHPPNSSTKIKLPN